MISVSEAQKRILETVAYSREETINISETLSCVLAKNILSPLDLPPFHQSAMDGYAIRMNDVLEKKTIRIIGESSAGKSFSKKISSGQAVRIFTGAEIPAGADAVVMQEKVSVNSTILLIEDENLKTGLNIRNKGSQIKKGEIALGKGTILTPAAIGFIASMGLNKVSVFNKPTVAIIVTGNELQKAGTKLSRGNFFESNGITIESALRQIGITEGRIFLVRDDEKQTQIAFKKALRNSDFILFSGGISVGDYDFVGTVLKKENVKEVFYKVKQKPGKPLYFGTKNKKYIFGLPGNPASVLTCFYEYVLPAIKKNSGHTDCLLKKINLPLSKTIAKKTGLTHFLKATTDFKNVTPLEGQESFIMRTYSHVNCLICFPEELEIIHEGELAEVHLF